jgi:hypothetical protein
MDDLSLAKALVERLSSKDLRLLSEHIHQRTGPATQEAAAATSKHNVEVGLFEASRFPLAIEFAESNAASFNRALTIARSAPHFSERLEGKKRWFAAAWHEEDYGSASELADALSGIRNRRVSVSGKELDWTEVFAFVHCAKDRAQSYRPNQHCFGAGRNSPNPWGCVQARMEWTEWAQWFSFGRFEKGGLFSGRQLTWVFDKKKIRHELERNTFPMKCCPHLQQRLMVEVLRCFPDRIEVIQGGDWKYHESYTEVPGAYKIVEKQKFDGYESTHEFYAVGVRPNGLRVFRQVLAEALKASGMDEPGIAALLNEAET